MVGGVRKAVTSKDYVVQRAETTGFPGWRRKAEESALDEAVLDGEVDQFGVGVRPNVSIAWYLWNSTVRGEIPRVDAICFADRPSAASCRTSRCLGVRAPSEPPSCCGPCFIDSRTSPASCGVR